MRSASDLESEDEGSSPGIISLTSCVTPSKSFVLSQAQFLLSAEDNSIILSTELLRGSDETVRVKVSTHCEVQYIY